MNFDSYLENLDTGELIRLLARAAQAPNEMTYKELEELILSGGLNDFLDFQEKYSRAVNEITPALIAAMAVASAQATAGKIILSDSLDDVKFWLRTHGAELVTNLSAESQKAIANILLMWQEQLMNPRLMAQQLRPLIGLSAAQVLANERYRQNIFSTLTANGMSAVKAKQRADKAAIRYASKQHRYRAETILHTELAFAYNQGADMGVRRAIKQGLMTRCAMRWTTAGTNRVCGRCLELKDKIIGYTDEAGVTLPPLHPRCRCSIEYEETGTAIPSYSPKEELKPRSLEEVKATADKFNPVVGKYFVRSSKWNGRVVTSKRGKNGKNPACYIEVELKDCPDEAIIHELVHAHSTSYYSNELYRANSALEEASVQYLTQEIAKAEGIILSGSGFTQKREKNWRPLSRR